MDAAWKIFTLIGLAIVGIGVFIAYSTSEKVKTVASWLTVPGCVVESTIMWDVEVGSSRRQSYLYSYCLKVRTDYMIAGQYFSNATPGIKEIRDTKFFNTDPWKNLPDEDMIRLFKQVPQGTMVPVHYNPENKAESYIFSKLPFWDLYSIPFFVILTGTIFLLLPLKIALYNKLF
jgi:hypothetical protein